MHAYDSSSIFSLSSNKLHLCAVSSLFLPAARKPQSILTISRPKLLGVISGRGHITSMLTLGLEAIAEQAPNVSFILNYPGFVETGMSREIQTPLANIMKVVFKPVMAILKINIDEVGERHTFFCTSSRFPSIGGEPRVDGLTLGEDVGFAVSTAGEYGGNVYSIDYEAEGTSVRVQGILARHREDGTAEKVWEDAKGQFVVSLALR